MYILCLSVLLLPSNHPDVLKADKVYIVCTFNPSQVQVHDKNSVQRKKVASICKLPKNVLLQHHDLQDLVRQTSTWIKSRMHSTYRQKLITWKDRLVIFQAGLKATLHFLYELFLLCHDHLSTAQPKKTIWGNRESKFHTNSCNFRKQLFDMTSAAVASFCAP